MKHIQHFGLHSEPFSLSPDPSFFFQSSSHREVMAALRIGLGERRGLTVVTGEVGTGKTTVLYTFLSQLETDVMTAYVANTKLPFTDLLRQICADLTISPLPHTSGELLTALNHYLLDCAAKGTTVALVIDEAQHLDQETFEQLRLLSNVETFRAKLLQIVLVGQPELLGALAQPALRQVAERVAVWGKLGRLSWRESRAYIAHRLQCAGGSLGIFTASAMQLAIWRGRGIPRRLNIVCHDAMLFAYGHDAPRVTARSVHSAVRAGRPPARLIRFTHALRKFTVPRFPKIARPQIPWWPTAVAAVVLSILIVGSQLYSHAVATGARETRAADAQDPDVTLAPALPQHVVGNPPPGISPEAWASSVAAGIIPAWRVKESPAAREQHEVLAD